MRSVLLPALALSAIALLAVGCATGRPAGGGDGHAAPATLTGRVAYPQRIALPPDAVLTVRLEDVSRADAAADVIAEQTTPTAGRQVPIPFVLSYERDSIQTRHRYSVRAEIRASDGTLLWLSDTARPVLTQGAPSDNVEVRLVQVMREQTEGGEMAPEVAGEQSALTGSAWRLVEITTPDGGAVHPEADKPFTISFGDDGRYSGQADCNRHGGSYEVGADGSLRLSQGLSTLRACLAPSRAGGFVRTLGAAETATVAGDRLSIQSGQGLLVFQRQSAPD